MSEEKHARLSPSNHRWVHCPGSVREESVYPKTVSKHALDGTLSHLLLEKVLIHKGDPEELIGQPLVLESDKDEAAHTTVIDESRLTRVMVVPIYIERRINEILKAFPNKKDIQFEIDTESRSDPGAMVGRDDWWGTADVTFRAFTPYEELHLEIIDYKDGRTPVDVFNNPQLIAYLYGKTEHFHMGDRTYRMTVIQPKTQPIIKYQDISYGDLLIQVGNLIKSANATDSENAPLVWGDHCRWCLHRNNCEEREKEDG